MASSRNLKRSSSHLRKKDEENPAKSAKKTIKDDITANVASTSLVAANIDARSMRVCHVLLSDPLQTQDLIVLGLPYRSTETTLKTYFSKFGRLLVYEVKRDYITNRSKGFGFIRFAELEAQNECLRSETHFIEGRQCQVKFPICRNKKSDRSSEASDKSSTASISLAESDSTSAAGADDSV